MTLITIKSLDHYVSDGQFTLTTVDAHPEINLLLFFVAKKFKKIDTHSYFTPFKKILF